jgi:hypothetical protein
MRGFRYEANSLRSGMALLQLRGALAGGERLCRAEAAAADQQQVRGKAEAFLGRRTDRKLVRVFHHLTEYCGLRVLRQVALRTILRGLLDIARMVR